MKFYSLKLIKEKFNEPILIIGQKRLNDNIYKAYLLGYADGLTVHKDKEPIRIEPINYDISYFAGERGKR